MRSSVTAGPVANDRKRTSQPAVGNNVIVLLTSLSPLLPMYSSGNVEDTGS
jgi:hypothetical protein